MKKTFALLSVLGMLAVTACGPSEAERHVQDSLAEKNKDSASDAMFDEAEKEMMMMDSMRKADSARLADSMKNDSIKKAGEAKPKGK
ncbi:MAG: hypothetical protein FD123_587 [Bacteroidetes bacterium]|nr:MAG: hypothetical protein FD123_587 [Bacteroidota bacterium]